MNSARSATHRNRPLPLLVVALLGIGLGVASVEALKRLTPGPFRAAPTSGASVATRETINVAARSNMLSVTFAVPTKSHSCSCGTSVRTAQRAPFAPVRAPLVRVARAKPVDCLQRTSLGTGDPLIDLASLDPESVIWMDPLFSPAADAAVGPQETDPYDAPLLAALGGATSGGGSGGLDGRGSSIISMAATESFGPPPATTAVPGGVAGPGTGSLPMTAALTTPVSTLAATSQAPETGVAVATVPEPSTMLLLGLGLLGLGLARRRTPASAATR